MARNNIRAWLSRLEQRRTGDDPHVQEGEGASEEPGNSGQLPDAHFGESGKPPVDWRKAPDEADPDDEQLEETPPDVVEMLGFDPAEEDEDAAHTHPPS